MLSLGNTQAKSSVVPMRSSPFSDSTSRPIYVHIVLTLELCRHLPLAMGLSNHLHGVSLPLRILAAAAASLVYLRSLLLRLLPLSASAADPEPSVGSGLASWRTTSSPIGPSPSTTRMSGGWAGGRRASAASPTETSSSTGFPSTDPTVLVHRNYEG